MNLIHKLLNDITLIPEASEGLQIEKQESEQKKSEADWAARLAIHFFSPLSQTKDYVLDNHGLKKCERCPCSCKKIVKYGDTSIGKNLFVKGGFAGTLYFSTWKVNKYWMGGEQMQSKWSVNVERKLVSGKWRLNGMQMQSSNEMQMRAIGEWWTHNA